MGDFNFLLRAIALHLSEEGLDDLWHQKIQACEDEGDNKTNNDLLFVGKEQVLKERVRRVFRAKKSSNRFEHLKPGFREVNF